MVCSDEISFWCLAYFQGLNSLFVSGLLKNPLVFYRLSRLAFRCDPLQLTFIWVFAAKKMDEKQPVSLVWWWTRNWCIIIAVCDFGTFFCWRTGWLQNRKKRVSLKKKHSTPWKINMEPTKTHLESKMIFQTSMIMFHVNLPECIGNCWWFPPTKKLLPTFWIQPTGRDVWYAVEFQPPTHEAATMFFLGIFGFMCVFVVERKVRWGETTNLQTCSFGELITLFLGISSLWQNYHEGGWYNYHFVYSLLACLNKPLTLYKWTRLECWGCPRRTTSYDPFHPDILNSKSARAKQDSIHVPDPCMAYFIHMYHKN